MVDVAALRSARGAFGQAARARLTPVTNLKAAVDEMVASLDELVAAIDAAPGALRPRMHSTLDTQMRGLRVLQEECAHGAPSRRSWSLGQASLPVVTSLVNAAAKPAVGVV